MPHCEVELYLSPSRKTLCMHPSVTNCAGCRAELCSSHISECETCNHFLCADCIVTHSYNHTIEEQKLKARA